MKRTTIGFIVVFDDQLGFVQPLSLNTDTDMPKEGILSWSTPFFVFRSRVTARAAINRTHHYAKAYEDDDFPMKCFCRIEKLEAERTE